MKYLVAIAAALLTLCVLALLVFSRGPHSLHSPTADGSAAASASPLTAPVREPRAGWREYANTRYKFSLFFPAAMQVVEHDEGGGASTVTFEDAPDAQGFQIFIVPYAESQVSEARFSADEPSGVRKGLTNIFVDGAAGAAFYSTDPALGDTREVWFISNGYLYEVTTLKPLAPLLDTILQSWKFI